MQATSISSWRIADLWNGLSKFRSAAEDSVDENAEDVPNELGELPLHILEFSTEFSTPVHWLANVERRIQDSVLPPEEDASCEWLTADAASTARYFLRDTCDLLPSEPQIFGTLEGHLVAEFETNLLRMTSIATGNGTKLFGYRRDNDEMPLQVEIRRGCNQHRDEVKRFTQALGVDSHGKALESET